MTNETSELTVLLLRHGTPEENKPEDDLLMNKAGKIATLRFADQLGDLVTRSLKSGILTFDTFHDIVRLRRESTDV